MMTTSMVLSRTFGFDVLQTKAWLEQYFVFNFPIFAVKNYLSEENENNWCMLLQTNFKLIFP